MAEKKFKFAVSPDWMTAFAVMNEDIGALYKERFGLNVTQSRILYEADYQGAEVRVGRLAQLLNLRPNTVTAAIDVLEERGLVIRKHEQKDRRAIQLKVSAKGNAAVKTMDAIADEYIVFLKNNLTEAKINSFNTTIHKNWERTPYEKDGKPCEFAAFLRDMNNLLSDVTLLMRQHGLSFIEGRIISHLRFLDEMIRVSTLGDILSLRPNVVTIAIDKLEGEGLVTRKPDPTDRRAVLLSLTQKGAYVVQTLVPEVDKLYGNYFESLPKNPPALLLKHSFKAQ